MRRLMLGLLLFMVSPVAAQDNKPARWEPAPCPANWQEHECGYLTVPEDYAHPEGPSIRLMVGIVRSTAENPLPDPVLVLVGGPGGRAVGLSVDTPLVEAIRQERDLIYLDQRGSGASQPSLACPHQSLDYVADMRACYAALTAQDINLAAYTTTQNAADVEMLRQTLGIERWNLWGTSYGTRLGLVVMRDYPDGVRSAILDSVFPPNANLYLDEALGIEPMLYKLFDACHDDLLCTLVYPDLQGRYERLFAQLEHEPIELVINDEPFVLDGDALQTGLYQLIADQSIFPLLPSLLDDLEHGEYELSERLVDAVARSNAVHGMALSVMCSEEAPFVDWQGLEAVYETLPRPYRPMLSVTSRELCHEWLGEVVANPIDNQSIVSDIPTLLLAGEYDTATPPRYAYLAAETLTNGYVVEFPRTGHVVLNGVNACSMGIVISFLDNPAVPPNTACASRIHRTQFAVGIPATRPWAWFSGVALGLVALALIGSMGIAAYTRPRQPAWAVSWRLLGWVAPLASVGLLVLTLFTSDFDVADTRRLVEIIVPLAVAFQAAFALTPDSDRALEILMACPRRPFWILLERLLVIVAIQSIIAMGGALLTVWITQDAQWVLALVRWIPPMLMLGGLAVYISIRSRVPVFAMVAVLLVWFGMVAVGDLLLPPNVAPYPLNYFQPWLWPYQPYLKPESLSMDDYWLNRLVVAVVGIVLVGLSLREVENEERMLTGDKA
ncbi:MAG: alpha/beta fold hydrolase [Anaerolineales bacterium]|nr:alpha/beta fold hydrolase [Anaerolineales bacterium]